MVKMVQRGIKKYALALEKEWWANIARLDF